MGTAKTQTIDAAVSCNSTTFPALVRAKLFFFGSYSYQGIQLAYALCMRHVKTRTHTDAQLCADCCALSNLSTFLL